MLLVFLVALFFLVSTSQSLEPTFLQRISISWFLLFSKYSMRMGFAPLVSSGFFQMSCVRRSRGRGHRLRQTVVGIEDDARAVVGLDIEFITPLVGAMKEASHTTPK